MLLYLTGNDQQSFVFLGKVDKRMITLGKWITKHKNIILMVAVILLVPSAVGYVATRVNYDVLSYLPATLETVEGQDILVDEFGMGAFSMVIAEGMTMKVALKEMPVYVVIASLLSLLVLFITMNSFLTPVIFLINIGMAVIYNLGSNIFLGEISYITKALAAVLQLAVTMDYSIFLLESYEANKERYPGDNKRAMAHAISNTFISVSSSSVTTIAGFLALCFMTFKLGTNIGIVMSKGVVIGVVACVTVLPAMILTFDRAIEKTAHREIIPPLDKLSHGIIKGRWVAIILFLIVLVPAVHGNSNYEIYYNIDKSLPKDIPSAEANDKLKEEFDMSNVHMVLLIETIRD